MAGMEIASLFAKVGADVGDFSKGMDKVKSDLSFAEKGIGGLQSAVGAGLKMAAGVGVAAIGALSTGIGYAVTKAADMEQGIANIAASMQLGADETADLKDLIMDLGLDPKLKTTAVEAAQAIEVLGTAGLTLDEIMNGAARSTVLLANSTGADFAQAGAIASDVMAQFNIKAADMAMAVDQITGVTVASKFDINDYGLAIAQAGGVAASVGVNFDDFNAVIAATSPSFASGSDGGTSFKTFLQRLVPTTNDAKQALLDLGLSTGEDVVTAFFDASGAMRPMEEIAENLQNAFSGLSESQKIEAASTIFGTDAMRTALSLAAGGGEIIAEMKAIIGNTSAEDAAATRMDTLRGAWEIFTGVVETLTLGIGDKFIPITRLMVDQLATLAQTYGPMVIEWAGAAANAMGIFFDGINKGYPFLVSLNSAMLEILPPDLFAKWMGFIDIANDLWMLFQNMFVDLDNWEGNPPLIKWLILVTDNIRVAGQWVADIITQFVSWRDVLTAVGVVVASIVLLAIWGFLAAAAPIVAMFALIIATSALLRNAWENDWLGIRTTILWVWDIIAGVFNSVMIKVTWIVDNFKTQWGILADTNATLGEKLALVWNTLKELAHTAWQGIVTAVTILWPYFSAALLAWGAAAWQWIVDATPIVLTKLGEWAGELWQWVTDNAQGWGEKLYEWAAVAWDWLTGTGGVASKVTTKMSEWGTAVWGWVTDHTGEWGKKLAAWGDKAWTEFGDRFPETAKTLETAWTTAQTAVTDAMQYLGEKFAPLGAAIKDFGVGALKEIGLWATGNKTDFENTQRIWQTAKETFGSVFTNIGNKLTEWGELAWGWFKEKFPNAADALTTAFDSISANFKELWDAIKPLIDTVVEAFSGLVEDWTTGSGEMSGALQTAQTIMDGIWTIMVSAVTFGVNTMINALTLVAQLLSGDWSGAWTTAQQIVSDALGTIDTITETVLTTVGGLFGINKDDIKTWYDDTKKNIADWWTNFSTQVANRDWTGIGNSIMKAFNATGIGEWYTKTTQNIRDWWEEVKKYIVDKDWFKYGSDIIGGLLGGIQDKWKEFTDWTGTTFRGWVDWFDNLFQFGSPSKLMRQRGQWLMEGLSDGIASAAIMPINAMDALANTVQGKVESMVNAVVDSAKTIHSTLNNMPALPDGYWSTPPATTTPTPTPVVTTPAGTVPNQVYTGGAGTGTAVSMGEKNLGLGLNMLATLVDTSDTIQDIIDFANQAKSFLTGNGRTPLQGSSAENLALRSLTSGGIDSLSINNLLASIQTLVRALTKDDSVRAGQEFNIQMAPNATLDQRQELEQLVSYLNALYG